MWSPSLILDTGLIKELQYQLCWRTQNAVKHDMHSDGKHRCAFMNITASWKAKTALNQLALLPFCLSRFRWNWILSSSISNIFTVPSSQPTWNRQHSCNHHPSWSLDTVCHFNSNLGNMSLGGILCEACHDWPLAVFPGCCYWWSRLVLHRPPWCTWASGSPGHTLWSLHSNQHWTDADPPNREPRQPCRPVLGSPVHQK